MWSMSSLGWWSRPVSLPRSPAELLALGPALNLKPSARSPSRTSLFSKPCWRRVCMTAWAVSSAPPLWTFRSGWCVWLRRLRERPTFTPPQSTASYRLTVGCSSRKRCVGLALINYCDHFLEEISLPWTFIHLGFEPLFSHLAYRWNTLRCF